MTELRFSSALEMARLLRARKISAKELLEVCLDQYALHNDTLNAIVVTDLGRAKQGFEEIRAAQRPLQTT